MTDSKKPPKGGSGEHPIVIEFRKKMDSIQDHTLPELQELAERIERLKEKSDRPPALPVIDVDPDGADPDSKDEAKS
jgi:hypothetical protein